MSGLGYVPGWAQGSRGGRPWGRLKLFIRLPDDAPTDMILHDLAGRQIHTRSSVRGALLRLPIGQLASGVYCIRVSDGINSKVKKLIIH